MAHIATSSVIRGAVWLQPSGDALDKIQKVIHRVHRRGGGPPVRPHITLLSGLETTQASAELKLKHLAQRMRPFKIRFETTVNDLGFTAEPRSRWILSSARVRGATRVSRSARRTAFS